MVQIVDCATAQTETRQDRSEVERQPVTALRLRHLWGEGALVFGRTRMLYSRLPNLNAVFQKILRSAIAARYRLAVYFFLIVDEQRRANPALARMNDHEERNTQVYDGSLHRVRPRTRGVSPRKARARYDSRHSARHQAPG